MIPSELAQAVYDLYDLYDSLPSKAKPIIRDNGKLEWTVLSSIILLDSKEEGAEPEPFVASLACAFVYST